MKLLLIIMICVQMANSSTIWDAEWQEFKIIYDKHYDSPLDEEYHHTIYLDNKGTIAAHKFLYSQGKVSFNVGMNQYGDLTNEEFNKMVNRLRYHVKPHRNVGHDQKKDVPDSIDWRDYGYVTDVKDQADCGSCYAFSATGSIEGQHFAKTGELVPLSEQQLIDCSVPYGNYGCLGGLIDYGFDYILNAGGIQSEDSYPYKDKFGLCNDQTNNNAANITGYVDLPCGDEDQLKESVGIIGPVSVAVDASQMSFQFYSGGVYYEPNCNTQLLNHGMLVVGYGSLNESDYWTVKNSWGTSWGMDGYILMSRNRNNNCGIASLPSYPTV